MKTVLVVTDNAYMLGRFKKIVQDFGLSEQIEYRRTVEAGEDGLVDLPTLDVRRDCDWIIESFRVVISLHCRQIFPPRLVNSVRCVNVHPGYIPENRGWYPQVFSIINKRPLGASIHVMTEEVDFGGIIGRKEVPLFDWDTSESAYSRVLEAECDLLKDYIPRLFVGSYDAVAPAEKGNVNYMKDFEDLCRISLDQMASYGQVIDHLRALSHGHHLNAYFDTRDGERVYITIQLHRR